MEENSAEYFNKQWSEETTNEKRNVVREAEERMPSGEDEKLKTWMDKKLPLLRADLDKVKEFEKAVHESK